MTAAAMNFRARVDHLIDQLAPTVESDNVYYHALRAARAAGELDRMTEDDLCSLVNWLESRLTLAGRVRELMVTTAERSRDSIKDRVSALKKEILSIDPYFPFPWDNIEMSKSDAGEHGADFTQRRRLFHQLEQERSSIGKRIGFFTIVFIATILVVLLLT